MSSVTDDDDDDGPGSIVGITTSYGAGQSGDRISVGAGFSEPVQTGPGAHSASCTMGAGSFLRGKEWLWHDADLSPPSSAIGDEE
jgi:hypothetical protein